ncbi:MAG: alpha-2-macroglobulin family protein, partial [Anaerolineales bacterium]
SVLSADYVFPFKGQGYYDFYDYDYSAGEGVPVYGTFGRLISESEGKTDAQGKATLDVRADLSEVNLSQLYTIEATITDPAGGQQVSGRVEVIVHQGEFYIGVRPEAYVGEAGRVAAVGLLTVDWASDPFPSQDLHVVFNDHQWNCALETDPETSSNAWTCNVKDTEVASADVTTDGPEAGTATASFTPPKGGTYQVKVTGTDAAGHTVTASTIIWVADPNQYVTWRQNNNDRITLIADRKSYRPGETAEILIPSPFQGEAVALVTVERGRILQHEVVRLTSNSTVYRLPITADFAPDVFFSILIVKGVDENNPAPSFKMGAAKLTISPEQQQLNVTLTPDKAKVGPRDTVTYAIKATDFSGKPVQAEFSVGVSDLAVLSLSAPNSGPILDTFYGERGLGVRTGLGLTLSIDRLNIQAAEAKGGGGGAEAGFDEVRSQFLDTAFWKADVVTGQNGEASISVTLPDNLTTWRLDARGLTADTLVGQSTVDIVATKDLLIRPQTPRFFVVGDQSQLAAVVNNNTAQDIQATVNLAGTGVTLNSPATQNVTVKANDRAEVTWEVMVEEASFADLTFSVEGGGLRDASKPTLGLPPDQKLPVYNYSAPETTATAGQLDSANSVLEAVSLPRRFDVTQGDLSIELDPSLAASMTGALDYLEHFPYECTEQTVSRFLPNVLTYRALKDLGLAEPELESRLNELVNVGLQRLYTRQHVDGGWGWWTTDESNAYLTAYVLFGLVKARQAGFAVNDGIISSAISFLQTHLGRPNATSETWQLNRQAFILYALAEAGQGDNSATVQLYDVRTRLDTYARAYLALAFRLIDPVSDRDDTRLRALLSDINNAAILSATGAHWEEADRDWWNMNTDTRSTAIVLDALVRLDPQNNLIPNVVRWLMTARKAQAWETTQETAWALIGLTDWMVASGELKGNYDYAVELNGNLLASGTVNPDNLRDPVMLKVAVADLLKDQANRLVINRGAGEGRLYYTAHLNVYFPVEDVRALSRGVIVSREYRLKTNECGGAEQPECAIVTEATAGQDIQVKVTLIAPNDLYYVVLEDPIPAGAEAVDTSLLTTSVVGQPPALNSADPLYYGWGWWWFSNTDLRDEKVVLFATYLPKGTYEYTYI